MIASAALALAASGAVLFPPPPSTARASAHEQPVLAIVGALVFDGTGAPAREATVIVRGERIEAVGPALAIPEGASVIDGRGKALLPGFFDLHTHWTPGGQPATVPQIATAYVRSGVTTVNDFHQQPESFAPRRAWLAGLVAPHVSFVARIGTPGGHGADWGDQATTIWINTPEAARAAVERLKPYRPDHIKAFTDGWRYGIEPDNSSMDEETLHALVVASHAAGWRVLSHTVTVDRGVAAARAGVDTIAHALQDRPLEPAELRLIRAAGTAIVPTLAVYDPAKFDPPRSAGDPAHRQFIRKFDQALANVKLLFDAGVPIGVGTDAGMTATPHGRSTLKEIELLVRAGLTPAQALAAATSVSAGLARLDGDRGTIAPGKRADLVLIDGRPWERIADIRRIDRVFIDGRLVLGEGAPPLPAANAALYPAAVPVAALIDDFERVDGRTALDTLLLTAADRGQDRSTVILQHVPRGRQGHALLLAARMSIKDAAYAGVVLPLTRGSVTPASLASFRGLRLELNGTGPFTIRLNGTGSSWSREIVADGRWQEVSIPFSSFRPVAGRYGPAQPWSGQSVLEVEIGASRGAGAPVTMQLDNMRFY